jgi:outer membrane protein assembly factor BamE
MRTPLIFLSVLILAACSTAQSPSFPHKIDVQQGNVIDQETVDKLKPGLTRSQVRFLLGTPLVVDPFRDNRWDYVYSYRKAGRLTEQKRLTLLFDHDELSQIQVNGFIQPGHKEDVAVTAGNVASSLPEQIASSGPSAKAEGQPPETAVKPQSEAPLPGSDSSNAQQRGSGVSGSNPTRAVPAPSTPVASSGAGSSLASYAQTSVVAPLDSTPGKPIGAKRGHAAIAKVDAAPQPVALRSDTNADAIKPDEMPAFPQAAVAPDAEAAVLAAVQNWAKAWSSRDEQGYLEAYSNDFKPVGGLSRAEWEERRRLLLNFSKKIDVRVESPVVEFPSAGRALVTFNQHYRSDAYHDNVIKQLLMGLQDGQWLILQERVLPMKRAKRK